MKEILKMARFDYDLARSSLVPEFLFLLMVVAFFVLLFTPFVAAGLLFQIPLSMSLVHSFDMKNDFGKIYGILPVSRKNIVHGRFLYLYISAIISEIIAILIAVLSIALKLNRFLPHQGVLIQLADKQFSLRSFAPFIVIVAVFAFLCVVNAVMESFGQIYGRDNDARNLMILIISILIIMFGYIYLAYEKEILPQLDSIHFPASKSIQIIICILINIAAAAFVAVFSHITASVVSKREL